MAINNWLSRALARSQVDTFTAGGTWVAGDTMRVTINGKSVEFEATTTTPAHMITGLLALLQASEIPEFAEVTWASPTSTTITGTSVTPGNPFIAAADKTTAGSGTFTSITTIAASGPNHYDDANNWSLDAVPVATNDVNIDLSLGSILYGLDQSAVTLASLDIYGGQTQNTIGLPRVNAAGYTEYRQQYLIAPASACRIDTQSPRVQVDFSNVETAVEVRRTGSGTEGTPACLLKGTSTDNTFEVHPNCSVGVAFLTGETSSAAMVRSSGGELTIGEGCTPDAVKSIGTVLLNGGATDIEVGDGELTVRGGAAVTSLDVSGGKCNYNATGTVTAALVGPGSIDCSGDISPRTFDDTTIRRDGSIFDPRKTITYTNNITLGSDAARLSAAN